MKALRFAACLAPLIGGCGADVPSVNPQEDLVRTLFEDAWNTGDLSALDPRMAADSLLFHYRGQSSYQSFQDLEGLVAHWRSAFPDLRMALEALISEGDLVAARVRYGGTHQGEWFGIPPTGRTVDVEEMMFFRFEGGRLVEAWEVDDQLTMRTQLGLIR
ncbi:MAG: ester cyclase [Gemmatimonadota bacterium]|nr:ester cyclase [Gemmatimonadota bacterium]